MLFATMGSSQPNNTVPSLQRMSIWSVLNPELQEPEPTSTRSVFPNPPESDISSPTRRSISPSTTVAHRTPSTSPECQSPTTATIPARQKYPAQSDHAHDTRRPGSPTKAEHRARERREFRPTYQQEEELFIWYHRLDLGMEWAEVRNAYNAQFPDRQRKGFQGIQCKYYRCCDTHGIPKVRDRNRSAGGAQTYGLRVKQPTIWYEWMRCDRNSLR